MAPTERGSDLKLYLTSVQGNSKKVNKDHLHFIRHFPFSWKLYSAWMAGADDIYSLSK